MESVKLKVFATLFFYYISFAELVNHWSFFAEIVSFTILFIRVDLKFDSFFFNFLN